MASDLKSIVRDAFREVSGGRSTDDVVIDDILNEQFVSACHRSIPSISAFECNWQLYRLRKSSGLGPVVSVRRRTQHGDYLHAAEIAARQMEDRRHVSIDRVLCSPEFKAEFDAIASSIAPGIQPYDLRKAALKLRKGRLLKPELIKRVADWGTTVSIHEPEDLIADPELMPRTPGIYIFSDRSGYLYIGEAESLRVRVAKHLDHSDRKTLARYFWEIGTQDLLIEIHAFRPDSEGRKKSSRRAYESDLIRTRRPRFNIQD